MVEPNVTVIVPVYNVQDYIERCVESIQKQTYAQFECVLIDDGSEDNSKQLIQSRIQADSRFKYIYQENSGPSAARNRGIEEATGRFLIFVDADDYVEKDYLKKLYESMKEENDIVCCGYTDISKYGTVFVNDFSVKHFSKNTLIECILKGTGGVLWGKIFKADIIKNNKIRFNKQLFMSEDMIFLLEYLRYVQNWDMIDETLYCYNRLNETGISRNINYKYASNYIKLNECLEKKLLELSVERGKITNLINQRMYRFIYQSILSEAKSQKSLLARKRKIEEIVNDVYLKCYIKNMETNIKSEKLNFIFIKKRMSLCVIFYIWFIEKLKSIRVNKK